MGAAQHAQAARRRPMRGARPVQRVGRLEVEGPSGYMPPERRYLASVRVASATLYGTGPSAIAAAAEAYTRAAAYYDTHDPGGAV